jgi:hypothetical protein
LRLKEGTDELSAALPVGCGEEYNSGNRDLYHIKTGDI